MQLTIRGYLGDFIMEYRVYIFQIFSIVVHLMCVIIPLFKIYMSRFKKEDNAKVIIIFFICIFFYKNIKKKKKKKKKKNKKIKKI